MSIAHDYYDFSKPFMVLTIQDWAHVENTPKISAKQVDWMRVGFVSVACFVSKILIWCTCVAL